MHNRAVIVLNVIVGDDVVAVGIKIVSSARQKKLKEDLYVFIMLGC